jgi:short-subunit dehydrogenase
MTTHTKTLVLITGASSGIGYKTAKLFAEKSNLFTTVVTARNNKSLTSLEASGCIPMELDVTKEESMQKAIQEIEQKYGTIDILINNAGYCQNGVVEELTPDELRRQFETNVFGLIRMTQLVLPGMRAKRKGRIINIGSVGGDFTTPGASAYLATKHALESFNDALRMEVTQFGIEVVLVKPGGVKTAFVDNSPLSEPIQGNPYAEFRVKFTTMLKNVYEQGRNGVLTPEEVAQVIVHAAVTAKPRTRYRVGVLAKVMPLVRRTVSDRMFDSMIKSQFGLQ